MASRGQAMTVTFTCWDTVNNEPKAGETSGTLTLRWIKDGVSSAPTDTTPAEVDATNAKGEYNLDLTGVECTAHFGKLCGISSNAGIVVIPLPITFEQLPTVAPGLANGLPQIGVAPLTFLNGDKTGYKLAADGVDLVLVAGKTLPNAIKYIGAGVAGGVSGAGTGTEVFKDFTGNAVVTVTVDSSGNRSSVVYA